MSDLQRSLKGKIVLSVTNDSKFVRFSTNKGEVVWEVEGDCCSHSWIENTDLQLVQGEVYSVDRETLDCDECIAYYGVAIRTAKGTGTIDFRNESNGYYGGYFTVVSGGEAA